MTCVSRLTTHSTRRLGSRSLARPRVNASVRRLKIRAVGAMMEGDQTHRRG